MNRLASGQCRVNQLYVIFFSVLRQSVAAKTFQMKSSGVMEGLFFFFFLALHMKRRADNKEERAGNVWGFEWNLCLFMKEERRALQLQPGEHWTLLSKHRVQTKPSSLLRSEQWIVSGAFDETTTNQCRTHLSWCLSPGTGGQVQIVYKERRWSCLTLRGNPTAHIKLSLLATALTLVSNRKSVY